MRERGTGSLKKRGEVWWIKFYDHGRPVRESAGTSDERKAKKLLRQRLGEVATGAFVDAKSVKYADLREAYFLDYETQGRKSLKRDGEGKPYSDAVNRLDAFFGGWKVSEIDVDALRKFQRELQEKGLSNASINRSVSALRRMFNIKRKEGKLRSTPYFPMLREGPPRKGFFERADYDALSNALPDYARLPLAIGFFTGMRRAEVLGLKWEQVNFLDGTIRLYSGETKNDDGRVIPISTQLRSLLVERYAKRDAKCAHVCWRLDARGNAVKLDGLRKVWEARCASVGLGEFVEVVDESGATVYAKPRCDRSGAKAMPRMRYVGKTFHDLRRSAVRNMVRGGVPERVAMAISGHKTRSVFDRYNIVSGADLEAARAKMSAYYENGHSSGTMDVTDEELKLVVQ